MPDGGDSMALYGVGATWEVTDRNRRAATGAAGGVTGAVGAGAMTVVGEDLSLVMTAVLDRPC